MIKTTVISAYPFHMFSQAQQLARFGVLDRLITGMPLKRVGLPKELVRSRITFTAVRRIARRVVPAIDESLVRVVVRDFDRWAQTQLGRPAVVNALSGFATSTLVDASSRGIGTCCDRGSWHILEQKRILEEESARLGCPAPRFSSFVVDRELTEYEACDRIIVPSEPARESFLRRGCSPARIAKVPYGVDVEVFSPVNSARRENAIICVGSVGLRKGQHTLVEAFRSLRSATASLTLVGPIDSSWRRYLDVARGDIRVTGALPREGVIQELQRASIFVLASVEEGLALVIAQAMACGLPIVATDSTGAAELVTPGREGLIVPSGNACALAEALEYLLMDPERAAEMGRAARARVESLGGWDEYGERIMDVFSTLGRQ